MSFSSNSEVGNSLVPSLFFSRWILTPLYTILETPSAPTMVRRSGARNVLSFPDGVFASKRARFASVAEEKNLNPLMR